jgi:hypothetical protein
MPSSTHKNPSFQRMPNRRCEYDPQPAWPACPSINNSKACQLMAARPSKRQCVYNYGNRWLNEWLNAFEAEPCAGAVCASERLAAAGQMALSGTPTDL